MSNIQSLLNGIESEEFPEWTVLLGIGAYNEDNLLNESEFYDLVIEEKMNSIPTASLMFLTKTEEQLQDQAIRIYLDGIKRFTGVIKRCSKAYMSNEVSCECLGVASFIQRQSVKEITDHIAIKSSEIIEDHLVPENWEVDIDNTNSDFILNYRLETGNYLQHINSICIQNSWEWWIEENDSSFTIATRTLKVAPKRGSESSGHTFTLEKTAYNAIIDKDKEKLMNAILVSGSSSQASNMVTTAAGFFRMSDQYSSAAMGYMIGSESVLSRPAKIGDTELYIYDASGYTTPGTYKIKIGDEELEYDAIEQDGDEYKLVLTGAACNESHEPGEHVQMISLMKAYVPKSVAGMSVWIGNEKIACEVDMYGLRNLERGIDDTPIYPHGDGTKIFSGEYDFLNPAVGSSIESFGQVDTRISNIGSTDRDGLDKHGVSILLNNQSYEQFGSIKVVVDELGGIGIGDTFYLEEKGSNNRMLRRCMGLKFEGDVVSVMFGSNEAHVLNQFDKVAQIDGSTYVKQDLSNSKVVEDISDDGTAVKYEKSNGIFEWVAVR